MKKEIQKAWKELKSKLHEIPQNKGKEISHINGRTGCFLACSILIKMQTKREHELEHKYHLLRTENMDLILSIMQNWNRHYGCQKIHNIKCIDCPLLDKSIRGVK